MKMEEAIKERHEFEDRITAFLGQVGSYKDNALLLDVRILELAMGRAYDIMRDSHQEEQRLDMMFKGHLLKSVYDAKNSGAKHGFMRRFLGLRDGFFGPIDDVITPFINYVFKYPIPITDELASAWASSDDRSWRKLLPNGSQAK